MELLALVGLFTIMYHLIYAILPWLLDCDIKLAFYEKFGKPMSSLKGKVIWITGASSGIGEHLAYVLAKNGCKLVLSARRHQELERVKVNCLGINKDLEESDIKVLAFDACDLELHSIIFNQVIDYFGKLDILVNNAGRSQRAKWENINIKVDREMFELNVFSVLSLSRLAVKHFSNTGSGHLVATSSIAGLNPVPFSASYCGTKHALQGYMNTLRLEAMDKQLPITVIAPGPIQTNFLAEAFTESPGEKFGVNTEIAKNKMSSERCATLMAVAIANELDEVWISPPGVLQLTYLTKYWPNIGFWIVKQLGQKFLQKLRDSKTSIK